MSQSDWLARLTSTIYSMLGSNPSTSRVIYRTLTFLGFVLIVYWSQGGQIFPRSDTSDLDRDWHSAPYLTMGDITLRRYDEQGHMTTLAVAKSAYQRAQNEPFSLSSVTITNYEWDDGKKEVLATIKAPHAWRDSQRQMIVGCQVAIDCETFLTSKNTAADSAPTSVDMLKQQSRTVTIDDYSTAPHTQVKSSILVYDMVNQTVTNQAPTIITRGFNQLTGVGLDANLSEHTYQLINNVTTQIIRPDDDN